jgi:hypothetical protein
VRFLVVGFLFFREGFFTICLQRGLFPPVVFQKRELALLKQMPWAMASGQLHPGEHTCLERVHSSVHALGVIKDGANPLTGTSDSSAVEHDKCQIVCVFAKWLVFGDCLLASERLFSRL